MTNQLFTQSVWLGTTHIEVLLLSSEIIHYETVFRNTIVFNGAWEREK
ncbi:MAG: hypothetical protein WCW35_07940 [Bacteroidota bacterium]